MAQADGVHDGQVRNDAVRVGHCRGIADGIASNTLWPRTMVATAAVQNLLGGDEAMGRARKPEVYSDAAYAVFTKPAREFTGNTLLCEDVLVDSGVTDLSVYDCVPGSELGVDLWVEQPNPPGYSPS
jgi:citronellol/citronellal dehydrogenase